MLKPRHKPVRTCVACRSTNEKRELLRVVRGPDGAARCDPRGKESGRGAYVCPRPECIALARKQKKLERALKVNQVTQDVFLELSAQAAVLTPADLEPPAGESAAHSDCGSGVTRE